MPTNTRSAANRQPSPRAAKRTRARVAIAGVGLGLLLGPVVLASPAIAERATDTTDRPADRPSYRPSDRPVDRRVDRPSDRRPDRDFEVLHMHCGIADRPDDGATRVNIGCRWRPATHPRAAGYKLWRIVDRNHRELVARGGLDMAGARDVVSADAHVVRYAVVAVDENGRRVGQSRIEEIILDDRVRDTPRRIPSRDRRMP